MQMLLTLLALIAPAHAIVDLRLTGAGGVCDNGGAGRIGLDGEVWLGKHLGIGARGAVGLDAGSGMFVFGPELPIRIIGGKTFAWVAEPNLGIASIPDLNPNALLDVGVFTGLQAKLLVFSLSGGGRVETYGFQESAATLEIGVGIGL